MKIRPTSKPGQVVMEIDRGDDHLLERSLAETQPAGWPCKVEQIMVPIDFSEFSQKALQYARPFAEKFGAKITLVHVVQPIPYSDEMLLASPQMEQMNAALMKESEQKLAELAAEELAPLEPGKGEVRVGHPAEEIVEAARDLPADLIIMATHGRTGLKHVLIGSTAERVVRLAPCPVLVVRALDREIV